MHSLRSRITILTICVTIVAVAIVTALSVHFIKNSSQAERRIPPPLQGAR